MQLPHIIHPKKFNIGGIYFEVVSYTQLTDIQASKIVLMFYKSRKFTKKHQGKLIRVVSQVNQDHLGLI